MLTPDIDPEVHAVGETPVGPGGPGTAPPAAPVYGYDPTPNRIPASAKLGLFFGGCLGGFVCGAALVGLVWLVVASSSKPSTKNSPHLLLQSGSHASVQSEAPVVYTPGALAESDLAFGEQQVEAMTRDRPEMLRYVHKSDAIWAYCVKGFAGASCGERIYWDPGMPMGDEYNADHDSPYHGDKGAIRLRKVFAAGLMKGSEIPCEELWSGVAYELESLRTTPAYNKLFEKALARGLNREQWIVENTRLEYGALRRTAKLYETVWKPMAEARGMRSKGSYWFVDAPDTYEDWISHYTNPDSYPWSSWGKYWDEDLEPYLRTSQTGGR